MNKSSSIFNVTHARPPTQNGSRLVSLCSCQFLFDFFVEWHRTERQVHSQALTLIQVLVFSLHLVCERSEQPVSWSYTPFLILIQNILNVLYTICYEVKFVNFIKTTYKIFSHILIKLNIGNAKGGNKFEIHMGTSRF